MTGGRRSILCPDCRKLVSRDVATCPYCGLARPGSWWSNSPWRRGFYDQDHLVRVLIGLNVGMFLCSLALEPRGADLSFHPFAFLSPGNTSLVLLGATGTVPIDGLHRWWSLVAASYLHGGLLHLIFNMMAASQLGPLVLREYGPSRGVAIYTLAGVVGYWMSYLAGIRITIGASAAICGLMGALFFYGRDRGGLYGEIIYRRISGWAAGILLFGFLVPGINNWAHIGGFVGGFLLALALGYREKRPEGSVDRALGWCCSCLTVAVLAWAVLTAVAARLF
ncbi:MAG: rhomboid family intramembrane serine protease [Thermodesulfobacteriota bacterium]